MSDERAVVVRPGSEVVTAPRLTPRDVVAAATEQANILMEIVEKQQLYEEIEGKKYLVVEGWQTIGAFNNVDAITDWIRPVEKDGQIIAYEAKVDLYRDGVRIGGAIMSCGLDEYPCRGKEGEARHKAAKSAAQTWAESKAYRMKFGYVAKLAGFEPTPAEEMYSELEKQHWCHEHDQPFSKFTKGKQTWYAHKLPDGSWCNESKQKAKQQEAPAESPAPSELKETEPSTDTHEGFVDLDWLKEQLLYLQSKKLKAWTNSNVLSYLKTAYGVKGDTPSEAVKQLTKEQAEEFVKRVQEAVELA